MNHIEHITATIEQLCDITLTDYEEVIDLLTGTCFGEEEAQQIKRILKEHHFQERSIIDKN